MNSLTTSTRLRAEAEPFFPKGHPGNSSRNTPLMTIKCDDLARAPLANRNASSVSTGTAPRIAQVGLNALFASNDPSVRKAKVLYLISSRRTAAVAASPRQQEEERPYSAPVPAERCQQLAKLFAHEANLGNIKDQRRKGPR